MLAFLLVSKLFNPRVPRLFSDIRRFLLLWAQGAICHLCHERLAVLYLQPCNNCNTNTQIRIHKYEYTNTNTQIRTHKNPNTQIHKYKYKYTSTHIQLYGKICHQCHEGLTILYLQTSNNRTLAPSLCSDPKNGFTIFPLPCPNPIHCMTTVDRHSFTISQELKSPQVLGGKSWLGLEK